MGDEVTKQQLMKPRGTGRNVMKLLQEDVLTEDFLVPEKGLLTVELWARSIVLYLTQRSMQGLEELGKPAKADPAVAHRIIRDIQARADYGREKYGEELRAFNGRDALLDARQEAHDLWAYLRQNREQSEVRK